METKNNIVHHEDNIVHHEDNTYIDAFTFIPVFIRKHRAHRLYICRQRIYRFFSRKSDVGIGDLRYSYRQLRKLAAECKYPLHETMWNGNTLGTFVTYVMEIILKRKRRSRRKLIRTPVSPSL
jgi:hypothetical protein